jgi:hypothetical protein
MPNLNCNAELVLHSLSLELLHGLLPLLVSPWFEQASQRLSMTPAQASLCKLDYAKTDVELDQQVASLQTLGAAAAPLLLANLLLQYRDERASVILLRALKPVATTEMLPELILLAEKHILQVRWELLGLIAEINDGSVDDWWCVQVKTAAARDRLIALAALAKRQHAKVPELAAALFVHDDKELNLQLLKAMQLEHVRLLAPQLIELLGSEHYGAAFYAAQKLGRIALEIAELLLPPLTPRGRYAKTLVIQILSKTKQEQYALPLCHWLRQDGNKQVRADAAKALQSLKLKSPVIKQQVFSSLQSALEHEQTNEPIRAIAATVLKLNWSELVPDCLRASERLLGALNSATRTELLALLP